MTIPRRYEYGKDGIVHAPDEQVRAALAAEYERGMQEGLDLRDELREQLAQVKLDRDCLLYTLRQIRQGVPVRVAAELALQQFQGADPCGI